MTKTNRSLFFIFLFLLGLLFIPQIVTKLTSFLPQKNNPLGFKDFQETNTQKILIQKDSPLILVRENSLWQINGQKVDPKAITEFFQNLQTTTLTRLVSQNPDKHPDFGLNTAGQISLTLTGSKGQEKEYQIGNKEGLTGFYLKIAGQNQAYLVQSSLLDNFKQTPADWQDKTILDLNPSAINQIAFDQTTYQKTDNLWQKKTATSESELTPDETDQLLALFPLKGQRFLTEEEIIKFQQAKNKTTLTVSSSDQTHSFTLFENNSLYFIKPELEEKYFALPSYQLSSLFK